MKETIKKTGYLLLIIVMLPIFSSCNNEDDVIEIFVGKTWKLTFIAAEGTQKQFNFWGEKGMAANNPAYVNSMNALAQEGNFILNFEGSDVNGLPGGAFNGKVTSTSVGGTWSASGKNQNLTINVTGSSSDKDVLGQAFITGLLNAIRYEGDSKNLYIYYKEGQTTKFMAFRAR